MKVTLRDKNSVGLRRHLNSGGTFQAWRHTQTTYNTVAEMCQVADGRPYGVKYRAAVVSLGELALSGLRNPAHIEIVNQWLNEKLSNFEG